MCIYESFWSWKEICRHPGGNSNRYWLGKIKGVRNTVQLGCTFNDWCIWKESGNTSFIVIWTYLINNGRNSYFHWCWREAFSPPSKSTPNLPCSSASFLLTIPRETKAFMGLGTTASTGLTCLDPVEMAVTCYYLRGVEEDIVLLRTDQQKSKSEIMSLHYQ